MAGFFLWCILLVLCWPLALLALIAYPFVWLISPAVSYRWNHACTGVRTAQLRFSCCRCACCADRARSEGTWNSGA